MSDTSKPPYTQMPDSQPPKPGEVRKGRHRRWVVHSHEASRPSHVDAKSDINITPLIDVMLVLLIIFMITAPLLTQGINVDLPKAPANPLDPTKDEPLVLSIDAQGRFFLNIGDSPDTPLDDAALLEKVSAIVRANPQSNVVVKGDQSVPYGRVVTGYALLSKAGVQKLGLLTDPKGLDPSERGRRGGR